MRRSLRAMLSSSAVILTLLLSGSAQAVYMEFDGGYFRPWNPGTLSGPIGPFSDLLDPNWYVQGSVLGGTASGRARFGGQIEYQSYTAEGPSIGGLFRNPAVRWDTWAARFIFQYNFMPKAVVQPYIGASFGFTVNRFDDSQYQTIPGPIFIDIQNIGVGIDIIGLVGLALQFPGADWFQIYGQAKFGYHPVFAATITNFGVDDLEVLNLGGINAGGGVRFTF